MNNNDVLAFHTGQFVAVDQLISNADYTQGAAYAASESGANTGRAGLSLLSAAILGVMFFYIATRGRQL